jgi:hypothetical protein
MRNDASHITLIGALSGQLMGSLELWNLCVMEISLRRERTKNRYLCNIMCNDYTFRSGVPARLVKIGEPDSLSAGHGARKISSRDHPHRQRLRPQIELDFTTECVMVRRAPTIWLACLYNGDVIRVQFRLNRYPTTRDPAIVMER